MKVQTNDKAFKELKAYADKAGKPLQEVLLSDEHLDRVSEIFYKNMPKVVQFTMKLPRFKEYYKNHREQLVAHMQM